MPSKKSFFNRTLFRKNLSRTWPLWGLLSLAGAMGPLYLLLGLAQNSSLHPRPEDFAAGLYTAATIFVPGFTAGYAVLCAMLVWGYLCNPRAVGLYHALPVSRTCLFATNTISGLAIIFIPFAVTGFLLCLLAVCWGFFDLIAVVNTVLAVVFLAAAFFGLATLCAMLTGHIFALPAFYLLVNFLSPILESLIFNMAQQFLVGISGESTRFNIFSPIVQIYTHFTTGYEWSGPDGASRTPVLHGLWVAALYALAGAGMLALAWLLYQKRHSERAGDVVAFRWLQPVFRYGLALLSGLTVGRLIYILLWENLFQRGDYADAPPLFVCVALGGLLGYYIASMLIEKSRRVFRGSLLGAGIVCAGAAALCLLVSVDVFGAERRVPEMDEIVSVQLEDRGILSGPFGPENNPDQAEAIRAFHQALVDDRDYIRNYDPDWDYEEGKVFSHYIRLTYQLAGGGVLRREYDLWFSQERAETGGTYESLLEAFYQDPVVRMCDVAIPDGADISSLTIFCDYLDGGSVSTGDLNPLDAKAIYDAMLLDAGEGSVPAKNVMAFYEDNRWLMWFRMEYRTPAIPWDGSWNYEYKDVSIHPQMVHTVEALLDMGYLTEEEAAFWAAEYEEGRGGATAAVKTSVSG